MNVNKDAGITKIEIERSTNEISVKIFTSRPGIVIGRGGQRIDELKKLISNITKNKTQLNIEEIRNPDLDATLVSHSVADQIQRRISYKRAARMAASRSMQNGAKGIKIICKGRLGGAEIARKEQVMEGAEAHTEYGRIGVKVWIYRGDIEISKQTHVEPSEIKPIELTLTPETSAPENIELILTPETSVSKNTDKQSTPSQSSNLNLKKIVDEPKFANVTKDVVEKPISKPKSKKSIIPKTKAELSVKKDKNTKSTSIKEKSDDTNL